MSTTVPPARFPLRAVTVVSHKNQSGVVRAASTAGMIVPGLFFAVMTVLGQITPHYNPISRFGSELSLGPFGWAMIANFIILSIAVLGLAVALRQTVGSARSGRLGAAMVGVAGAAFLVAGIFVTDLHGQVKTLHGAMHFGAAMVMFFIAVPIGGAAMARFLRGTPRLSRYSALTGVATPVLFIATVMSGPYLGLMERVVIGVELAWLTMLAVALHTGRMAAACTAATSAKSAAE